MIRLSRLECWNTLSIPRESGDDPTQEIIKGFGIQYSPRERG